LTSIYWFIQYMYEKFFSWMSAKHFLQTNFLLTVYNKNQWQYKIERNDSYFVSYFARTYFSWKIVTVGIMADGKFGRKKCVIKYSSIRRKNGKWNVMKTNGGFRTRVVNITITCIGWRAENFYYRNAIWKIIFKIG